MNAQGQVGDPALHNLQPSPIYQPLLNSIPSELVDRFDPVYVEHYNRYNAGRLHTHQIPIETYRANPGKYTVAYGQAAGPDIYKITEQKCPVKGGEITIRIFEPKLTNGADGKPKLRGAFVNFHGGGWVFGGLAMNHHVCKRIVHDLAGEVAVFDVDYRLAPEYKYPTAIEDCWAAFQWVCR